MTQRDVPGATRGIVPLLETNGVRAYAGGVNTASLPPHVPRAFVWRDEASGKEILGMVHPHGYGGIGVEDCVVVDGASVELSLSVGGEPDRADSHGRQRTAHLVDTAGIFNPAPTQPPHPFSPRRQASTTRFAPTTTAITPGHGAATISKATGSSS